MYEYVNYSPGEIALVYIVLVSSLVVIVPFAGTIIESVRRGRG